MKIKYILGALLAALLLLGGGASSQAVAQSPSGAHLRVLESDERAIVLELTVGDFEIETVEAGGQTYHRVLIPGAVQTGAPGAPQVPARGALLGLPTAEGVSVRVLQADYETRRGYRLHPAPGRPVPEDGAIVTAGEGVDPSFPLDEDVYATDAFYPGRPVEVDATGYVRDQAVAQVRFYPVQHNPVTGALRIYRRILAQVTWDSSPSRAMAAASARGASPAFEGILSDVLLNYPDLHRSSAPFIAEHSPRTTPHASVTGTATPTLKIGVTEDGLYELTYEDLAGAGLDPGTADARTIKMSNHGAEIPIHVDGEGDGVFDPGDTILFYGTAVTGLYTSENVYWLTVGGGDGQRMAARDGTPSGAPVPVHFPVTLHAEQDTEYQAGLIGGTGLDHWFWGERLSAPETRAITVPLRNVSTAASTATLRVRLRGYTAIPAIDPDHHTRIYLNGNAIDDAHWDGQTAYDHEVTVSHSFLSDGNNVIAVEGVGDTGALVDQFYLNWAEVEYWDTYVAEDDELLFGSPAAGTFQFEVAHFGAGDVQVFDVTDPADVAIVTNAAVVAGGDGYTLQFEQAAQPDTRYLALTAARHRSPVRMELDAPSSWRSPGHGADYVIITHEDFYTGCLRLAAHRQITSGLRVATVKVADVYDEFNHGILNPQAIRDFLTYAYQNWVPPAPAFVLLVGDATYDYRDNLGTGTVNYVPSQLVETELETASDNWFVQVSGDDILPDMFIGRLPVQTASQVDDVVDKIVRYEQYPPGDDWNRNVLLVADDDAPVFEAISEQIAGLLPPDYVATRVYAGDYPPGDPTVDIASAIDGGSIIVNYSGHGRVNGWGLWDGTNDIFGLSDITALNNTHKLPLVVAANCLNGFFIGAQTEVSAGEAFLRLEDRGAVAVWASTDEGYASDHQVLMGEFYESVFQDGEYVLGAATSAAKIAAYSQDTNCGGLVQTFVLFGDPALALGLPYPYVKSTTPANRATDVPIDQDIRVIFHRPMNTTTVALEGVGAPALPLTPTWSGGDTVVTYAHPGFGHGQALTLTVDGQDKQGTPLGVALVPSTWSFVVTDDDSPPHGTIGVEGGALADVSLSAAVIITFTEPMRTSSVATTCAPPVTGWLSWDADGQVARFDHASFKPLTHYTFTVTAAKDVAGNPMPAPLALSFTTGESLVYLPLVVKDY